MPNPNHINDNGTWRSTTNLYAKNNGSWVEADEGWKNVNGTWTKFYDKWAGTTTTSSTTSTTTSSTTSTSTTSTTTSTTTTTSTQDPSSCASTIYAWGFTAPNTAINGSWAITNPVQYHDARPVYTKGSLKLYYSSNNGRWEIGSTAGGTPDCNASTGYSVCPYGSWTCGGTIDGTPEPTEIDFYSSSSSVTEGNSGTTTHNVTVNRSGNMDGTATVAYATSAYTSPAATAGVDYTAASGTLTFNANVTSQTISISITGDTTVEDDEGFMITLSSPTQTVGTASIGSSVGGLHIVSITNDDTTTTTTGGGSTSTSGGGSSSTTGGGSSSTTGGGSSSTSGGGGWA